MNKKYRVVFLGLIRGKDEFSLYLSKFGIKTQLAERIVSKAPVTLKENLHLESARRYADVFQNAGGKVSIESHGVFEEKMLDSRSIDIKPLENFIMCPQCGYKQLKDDLCERCGSVLVDK
ncbi:MAG: hypothetical protein JW882_05955 [Deltaproteobacteria bacterium]|nr:hypothetical protein [Deltaproteobacteria bacterium]